MTVSHSNCSIYRHGSDQTIVVRVELHDKSSLRLKDDKVVSPLKDSAHHRQSHHTGVETLQLADGTYHRINNERTQIPQPTDRGFRAWSVLFGAWCMTFSASGWLNSIGVFQDYYSRTMLSDRPASDIAWITSLQLFLALSTTSVVGCMFDRYGIKWLLVASTTFLTTGLLMLSIATTYVQILVAQGIFMAFGIATIYQSVFSVVSDWFDTKKAVAFGVLTSGSCMGGVVLPIMFTHLVDRVGFTGTCCCFAGMNLALATLAGVMMRIRTPPKPKPFTKQAIVEPLKDPSLVLVCVGYFFMTMGYYIPVNYINVDARSRGMSVYLAQYMVSILNATGVVGRISLGLFADYLGRYNVSILFGYCTTVLILTSWLLASGNGSTIAFAAVYGLISGPYASLSPALLAQISPYDDLGYRIGLMLMFGSWAALMTGPIGGALLQRFGGSFVGVKIYSGAFYFAGTTCFLCARLTKTGFRLRVKF